MKLLIPVAVLQFLSLVNARSATEYAALVEECGDLGVMELPEGMDPSLYRHCAGHPLGADRRKYKEQSLAPYEENRNNAANVKAADIFRRKEQACWYDSALGCTRGYCWKACGNPGEWCWTAEGDGGGKWLECNDWRACDATASCSKGCLVGKACGCNCS